jgi:hypothetical protein
MSSFKDSLRTAARDAKPTDEPLVSFDHPKAIKGKVIKAVKPSESNLKSKPSSKYQHITSKVTTTTNFNLSGKKIKPKDNPWELPIETSVNEIESSDVDSPNMVIYIQNCCCDFEFESGCFALKK